MAAITDPFLQSQLTTSLPLSGAGWKKTLN